MHSPPPGPGPGPGPAPVPGPTPAPTPAPAPAMSRGQFVGLLAAGTGLLLTACVLLLGPVRTAQAEADAFRIAYAAPSCDAARPDAADRDCVRLVPGTLRGHRASGSGKGSEYWVSIADDGARDARWIRLDGRGPLYEAPEGSRVTSADWRGSTRVLRFGEVSQHTRDAPDGAHVVPQIAALTVAPLGAMMLVMAWWYRRHPDVSPTAAKSLGEQPPQLRIVTLAGVLLTVTGIVVGILAEPSRAPLWMAGATGATLCLALPFWLRTGRRARRGPA
ncbi:hypothetical protein ACFYVL_32390 [Streptomyces sp. NPDC004111]|uniref:hypothetical protein n=1 Tax=Streptomyces sp. NPDC004111 TaxID=3364690 RepID=UPI0036A3296B